MDYPSDRVLYRTKPFQVPLEYIYEGDELTFLKCPTCGYLYSAFLLQYAKFKLESCNRCNQWLLLSE